MKSQVLKHRFTVADYYRMAEVGILTEDDRVELIDGEIVRKSPVNSPHAAHVDRLLSLLAPRAGKAFLVRIQNPVRLDDYSEPEPDVALLRHRSDAYLQNHPGPRDTLLLVEIADSSLDYDRNIKVPLYAKFGIPEVWVVNLPEQVVEVYREPTADGYRSVERAGRGESATVREIPDVTLAVRDILIEANP